MTQLENEILREPVSRPTKKKKKGNPPITSKDQQSTFLGLFLGSCQESRTPQRTPSLTHINTCNLERDSWVVDSLSHDARVVILVAVCVICNFLDCFFDEFIRNFLLVLFGFWVRSATAHHQSSIHSWEVLDKKTFLDNHLETNCLGGWGGCL